jgi:hypothetical protein
MNSARKADHTTTVNTCPQVHHCMQNGYATCGRRVACGSRNLFMRPVTWSGNQAKRGQTFSVTDQHKFIHIHYLNVWANSRKKDIFQWKKNCGLTILNSRHFATSHSSPWWRKQQASLKRRYTPSRLHGTTSQKANHLHATAVKNLKSRLLNTKGFSFERLSK